MKLRTLAVFGMGAAAGAGATYLLDPDHGAHRRRDARRHAMGQARRSLVRLLTEGGRLAREVLSAALDGYRHSRGDPQF